jgi:hypothetical protein
VRPGRRNQGLGIVAALCLVFSACGGDGDEKVPLYSTTAPPAVPEQTSAINPAWVESSGETLGTNVAAGQYWATVIGLGVGADNETFVDFDLTQAFFGDACLRQFTDPELCVNDYGVLDEPHGSLPAFVGNLTVVSVVGVDQRNFSIDGAELASLIGGAPPATEAPDDFAYAPFPFIVTVTGGTITGARQIFTP